MDPWLGGALALAVLMVCKIAGLSALETAVINARRSRMPAMAASRLAAIEALLEAPDPFLTSAHLTKSLYESLAYASAALAGIDVALQVRGVELGPGLPDLLAACWPGVLVAILVTYVAITLLGEALPKAAALPHAERLLVFSVGVIRIFVLVMTPWIWSMRRVGRFMARGTGSDLALAARAAHSEEEIKLLVEGSAEEGVLEEEEKEMIHSIIDFPDTTARQVMVPRIDVAAITPDTPLPDVVEVVLQSGHSRLPVYEGTLDNVIGVLHVKDILAFLVTGQMQTDLRPLLREPYFVPESKRLDELLQELRQHKTQMAVVVDEFGGTSGLVTVEDVLEEIVGEIQDEYDLDESPPEETLTESDSGASVDGRMTVDELNTRLGLSLPEGDYETLSGFLLSQMGRVPSTGEQLEHHGHLFVVEAMDGTRIVRIRIVPVESGDVG